MSALEQWAWVCYPRTAIILRIGDVTREISCEGERVPLLVKYSFFTIAHGHLSVFREPKRVSSKEINIVPLKGETSHKLRQKKKKRKGQNILESVLNKNQFLIQPRNCSIAQTGG